MNLFWWIFCEAEVGSPTPRVWTDESRIRVTSSTLEPQIREFRVTGGYLVHQNRSLLLYGLDHFLVGTPWESSVLSNHGDRTHYSDTSSSVCLRTCNPVNPTVTVTTVTDVDIFDVSDVMTRVHLGFGYMGWIGCGILCRHQLLVRCVSLRHFNLLR